MDFFRLFLYMIFVYGMIYQLPSIFAVCLVSVCEYNSLYACQLHLYYSLGILNFWKNFISYNKWNTTQEIIYVPAFLNIRQNNKTKKKNCGDD